ncbi:hypothetical protein [Bacillus sp. XF8]|uniref:hypothetical protein n=1 Tax=Bacillus sp. XF8 TaxID=2819289 RepID=UPI001AA073F5|nr:hypothetical protein [Bacillus sp. XF8]MBO1583238.1 hypothetical protein [Bacillus sp. XF8]
MVFVFIAPLIELGRVSGFIGGVRELIKLPDMVMSTSELYKAYRASYTETGGSKLDKLDA